MKLNQLPINEIVNRINQNIQDHDHEEYLTTEKIRKYNNDLDELIKALYEKRFNK